MVLRQEDPKPRPFALPPWMAEILREGKGIIAFAAVLIYGVARVATEAFYREFGLSPDEIGVSRSAIIAKAAVSLVLFVAAITAAVILPVAVALWAFELADPGGHKRRHAHGAGRAPAAWALFGLVALLPMALTVLNAEFLHFLLGYNTYGSIGANVDLAVGAWTALLGVLLYAALTASCPLWSWQGPDREQRVGARPANRVRIFTGVMFVPVAFAVIYGTIVRAGQVKCVDIGLIAGMLSVPLVAAWQIARNRGRAAGKRAARAALASSLAFYVLLLPLAVALLSANRFHVLFPAGVVLEARFGRSYVDTFPLLAHLWWLPVWLAAIGVAARVAWSAIECRDANCVAAPTRAAKTALVGVVAFVSLALLLLADDRGTVLARRVEIGDEFRSWASLLVVSSEAVCLTGGDAPSYRGPYLFLGKAGDKFVLERPYDRSRSGEVIRDHETIRISASAARLTFLHKNVYDSTRDDDVARCAGAAGG